VNGAGSAFASNLFQAPSINATYHNGEDGTFGFRIGTGTGTTRHINLGNSTSDPSAVGSSTGISSGQRGDNQPYYLLYVKSPYNNGLATYTRMSVGWHTGLELGGNPAYGGTRIMNDSPGISTTELMAIGYGDQNVRISNTLFVPYIADRDNTSFYLNPADTGNSINIAGSLRAANYNRPAIMSVSSGTSSSGGSLAIQQETAEGWTGIFVDYEPYTGWGLWHDNPNNLFCFTAEASTGQIRSFTVPSRVSGNRTAYEKFRIDQNNGDTITGRIAYANESSRSPIFYDNNNTAYYVDPNGGSRVRGPFDIDDGHGGTRIRLTANGSEMGTGTPSYLQMWVSEPGVTWNDAGFGYNVHNDGGSPSGFGRINGGQGQAYMRFSTAGHLYFYNTNTSGTRYSTMDMYASNYIYVHNYLEAGGSLRAPIFYDSNDTSFYSDHNNSSRFSSIFASNYYFIGDSSYGAIGTNSYRDTVNSGYDSDPLELVYYRGAPGVRIGTGGGNRSLTAGDIYSNAWYRQNTSNGFYWQPYDRGFFSPEGGGNSYGHVTTYGGGRNGWYGWGIASTHCLMSTTGDNVGLHDNRYSWIWYWDGGAFNVYRGYTYSVGSMRTPIFYDSNNTGYYIDGDNTSSLNALHTNNHYIRPGYMLYSDPGGWTGEYYKIQWHSSHLYFQRQQWGYFIFRNPNGSEAAHINDNNLWLAYLGWMSNNVNQSVRTDGSPTFNEVYANGWFRNQGGGGLYSQSYGGHSRTNLSSSYGCWETWGYYRGGYGGMLCHDPSGYWNNLMFERGNGGIYVQNRNGWSVYYSADNNCAALTGSTTYGWIRFNLEGPERIRQFTNWNWNADGNMDVNSGFGVYLRSSGGYNLVMQTDGYNNIYCVNGGGSYGGVVLYPYYYGWSAYSDASVKNIHGVITNVLDKVDSLIPIYYTYKIHSLDPEYVEDDIIKMGFTAQNVQSVFPELVRTDEKSGLLTLSMDSLIPVLVQSIKELRNETNFLKAQNEYLLERIENLENS
jgi:hypothetical protein